MDPARLQFAQGARGKPAPAPQFSVMQLRFNVSSSAGLVLYAVTRGRDAGVDIEAIQPAIVREKIPERCFSPREVASLRALSVDALIEAASGESGCDPLRWTTVRAGHVLLATGYRVDIKKLSMIHPALRANIKAEKAIPILNPRFESSVPGLYFIGLIAMPAFGPLFRFVVGCEATARCVARSVARTRAALGPA